MYEEQLANAGIPLCLEVDQAANYPKGMRTLGDHVKNLRFWLAKHGDCENIVFSDAWDVLFYGNAEQVVEKIPERGVLLAAERNCFPDGHLAGKFVGLTPWKFANGGVLAARTEELRKWLDGVERHPLYQPNLLDQEWFNLRLLEGDPLIRIDRQCELFYCMHLDAGEMGFQNGHPFIATTQTHPQFIHFNGKHDPTKFLRQAQGQKIPPNVFIATPMYRSMQLGETLQEISRTGKFPEQCKGREPFLFSLMSTMAELESCGIEYQVHSYEGSCYTQFARNMLVKRFRESGLDHLFFVDDDLSWEPAAFLKVFNTRGHIVAGAYRKKSEGEDYPVVVHCDREGIAKTRRDGAILASHVPTGFLKISRPAIELLISTHPHLAYSDLDEKGNLQSGFYDLFPQGVEDGRWWGEDFAFCRLWTRIGGEIALIPNITLTHWDGQKQYTGNYHHFLCQQPGGSEASKKQEDESCHESKGLLTEAQSRHL